MDPPENTPLPEFGSNPTPSGYQRTTGGQFRWSVPTVAELQDFFPQYEILGLQGQGGMGAVFRAHQKSLGRLVAIKVLPSGTGDDNFNFAERFKNEARTLARMDHPGIVHVHDFGETNTGLLYIVMEFIEGSDVQQLISSQGVLTPAYAIPITQHVCDALT
ncbi:MAG: protein kinase [Prosthecobacter sp.]|nr:protein kinase [Prosthecobacter sp.]